MFMGELYIHLLHQKRLTAMNNISLIVFIIDGIILMWLFFYIIFNKKKVFRIRIEMQKKGLIDKNFDTSLNNFLNIFFWMIPILKFRGTKNEEYNNLAIKINYALIGVLVGLLILIISFYGDCNWVVS